MRFAISGGPRGQNVNKVNSKVDMRFNVKDAQWLSDRVRERIMHVEKNRINKDGEIVISSTKTRTHKGNIEDALGKLQGSEYLENRDNWRNSEGIIASGAADDAICLFEENRDGLVEYRWSSSSCEACHMITGI
ncbi:hypothetical protein POM88_022010 [Heracleum sosnowskyi]|uniref:Prokaryotic-type class I peptide chain release factors domain-containing protein n=1 Tax=Heracleum sosnowskyi TaxID=360622 RepID=A0AAD8IEI4_9APIA|nr:hypothetical protein POM88_022010 [Heracleum sosnowskyi]